MATTWCAFFFPSISFLYFWVSASREKRNFAGDQVANPRNSWYSFLSRSAVTAAADSPKTSFLPLKA